MGKKAKGEKPEAKRLHAELIDACKSKDTDKVLALFHEACDSQGVALPQYIYHQVFAALANAAGDEASLAERHKAAQEILSRPELQALRSETLYSLMIRLAGRAGLPQVALQYLDEMRTAPHSFTPRIRTFLPILESLAPRGLHSEFERLFKDLNDCCGTTEDTTSTGTSDTGKLWHDIFDLRLKCWMAAAELAAGAGQPLPPEQRWRGLEAILSDLGDRCPQLCADFGVQHTLSAAFGTLGWAARLVEIGDDGQCPASATVLQAVRSSTHEIQGLMGLIERLATEHAPERAVRAWAEFKASLRAEGVLNIDVVIDGANVGHHVTYGTERCFSHVKVDEVVAELRRLGYKRIALVLRGHWLRPATDFRVPVVKRKKRRLPQLGTKTVEPAEAEAEAEDAAQQPVPEAGELEAEAEAEDAAQLTEAQLKVQECVERWKREGLLATCPPFIDDDWVSLYLALAVCAGRKDVRLVSNDEFRDHFFRMRFPPAFSAWRERHLMPFLIATEPLGNPDEGDLAQRKVAQEKGPPLEFRVLGTRFFPPAPYSFRVQKSAGGRAWHFPMRPREPPVEDRRGPGGEALQPPAAAVSLGGIMRDPQLWKWLAAYEATGAADSG